MIIDCHGHYTTAPGELEAWRKRQIATLKDPAKAPSKASLKISDDQLRESVEGAQLKLQRERGTDLTIFSPRAELHGAPHRQLRDQPRLVRDLQRADPPRLRACTRRTSSASASCRSRPACRPDDLHPRARALREGVRLRRLQPQPRPLRRATGTSRRSPTSGGTRSTRRWSSSTCRRWCTSAPPATRLPHHRRALHQCRHHRVHAVPHLGPVQGLPDAEVHHPARRRRGALPLGPLPRPGAGHEAPAAEGAAAEERVLRHLRLPPARHRAAAQGRSRSTTSCSPRRWSARCAASTPRPGITTTTPSATSTRIAWLTDADRKKIYEDNARKVYPRLKK